MIRLLRLEGFARLPDVELEMSRSTLIFGGNGSGKTTVFDALTAAILESVSGQGTTQPSLHRYGAHAAAQIEWGVEPAAVPAVDYWTLHAAREGALVFCSGIEADDHCVSELDARLRRGSVDLEAIATLLDERASHDPATDQNQKLESMRRQLLQLEQQLQTAAHARRDLMALEADVHRLSDRIAAFESLQRDVQAELQNAGAELAREMQRRDRLIEERREAIGRDRQALRQKLEQVGAYGVDLEALAVFGPLDEQEREQFDSLVTALEVACANLESMRRRRAGCDARLRDAVDEIADARAAVPLKKRAATRAASMKIRLERFQANPAMVERRAWRGGPVVAACVFFAGGLLVATTLRELAPYLGIGVGMTLGTFSLALGRRIVREAAPGAEGLLVDQLRQAWNTDTELPPLNANGAREVLAFCDDQIRVYSRLTASLEKRAGYKCGVEEDLARVLDHSLSALETTFNSDRAALDAWLAERELDSPEACREKIATQFELQARVDAPSGGEDLPSTADGCVVLATEISGRLDALDVEEAADSVPECDALIGTWMQSEVRLQSEYDQHDKERLDADTRRVELTAKIDAERPRLTQEIVARAAERRQLERSVADVELERRAAAKARQLLGELLGAETPPHLRPVVAELESYLQACGSPISQAALAGLDAGSLRIQDVDGELRPLGELSTGWRQLIILAARLALATVLGEPAIPLLVLEEPFAGLDQERLACGVRLLAEFQRRTEWQVVLLTRDERVRSAFSDQLDNVRLVDLSRLG